MADRALSTPHLRKSLQWLGKEEGHFQYAIGGDGAPVNKADDLTMIMVSFLNSGSRVGSPNENFILAARSAKKTHPVWLEVVKEAGAEGEALKGKTFNICRLRCQFTPRLVPADMKWLAYVAGELENSATFFSTFANISLADMRKSGKTFSLNDAKKPDFRPWRWEERMAALAEVNTFKETSRNEGMSENRKHGLLLHDMAHTLKTRQEREPALGKFVDCATVDPLHVTNNEWEVVLLIFVQQAWMLSTLELDS